MKKVTVLSPCFNGEKYLGEFFDSLLNQTYKNFDIVFVDDGSVDSTKKICSEYENKFKSFNIDFKYIYQENQGQAAACNNGLKHVTGDYLYWPDSDDWIEKDAIEKLATFLENNTDYQAVRGYVKMYDEETNELLSIKKPKEYDKEELFEDYLLISENVYCFTGVIMIDFNYFKKMNLDLDIYINSGGQNWQMILPVAYKGKIKYIDEHIYNYRVSKGSHSHSITTIADELERINVHLATLKNVLQKIIEDKKEFNKYMKMVNKKYFERKTKLRILKVFPFLSKRGRDEKSAR